jgi:hypothetical protein
MSVIDIINSLFSKLFLNKETLFLLGLAFLIFLIGIGLVKLKEKKEDHSQHR